MEGERDRENESRAFRVYNFGEYVPVPVFVCVCEWPVKSPFELS